MFEKLFVTVGTTRFDLLCNLIIKPSIIQVLKKIGCREITFQIGNSNFISDDYELDGVKIHWYRFTKSIENDIQDADFVISHAGAGSVLEVLEANKPLLVVINEDLMDNHQLELAEQMQMDGHLYYCTCKTLLYTLERIDFRLLKPLQKADPNPFFIALDKVLNLVDKLDG